MPISLVDQQLSNEISSLLKGILSNYYIINRDILAELPDDVSQPFIETYGIGEGYKGVNIPIYFNFPDTPPTTAFVLIQYEGGEEDTDSTSLGMVQGSMGSTYSKDGVSEKLKVHVDTSGDSPKAFITPSKTPYSVAGVQQVSKYNLEDDGNIYVKYFDLYKDNDIYLDVTYYPKADKGSDYIPLGTVLNEKVTVDFIASNTNTIRCLSALMTYISIYLRTTLENNGNVFLPKVVLNGMDLLEDITSATDSAEGQQLRYRRMEITYKVTQSINMSAVKKIEDIDINKEGIS